MNVYIREITLEKLGNCANRYRCTKKELVHQAVMKLKNDDAKSDIPADLSWVSKKVVFIPVDNDDLIILKKLGSKSSDIESALWSVMIEKASEPIPDTDSDGLNECNKITLSVTLSMECNDKLSKSDKNDVIHKACQLIASGKISEYKRNKGRVITSIRVSRSDFEILNNCKNISKSLEYGIMEVLK